jgi:hypothetical protein
MASKVFFCGFLVVVFVVIVNMHEKNPAAMPITQVHRARPSLKGSSTLKKRLFPKCHLFVLLCSVASSCPQVGKRKDLSRYHLEEKKSRIASSLAH